MTKNTTVLYYIDLSSSQFAEVSPILRKSTAHYCFHSDNYMIISNIPQSSFSYLDLCGDWSYHNPFSLVNPNITSTLNKLSDGWSKRYFSANCPEVEIYCFARTLVLQELFNRGIIDGDSLIFAHDWDDLVFYDLDLLYNMAEQKQQIDKGLIATTSIVDNYLEHLIQPAFTVVNHRAITQFQISTEHLISRYTDGLRNLQTHFSDMRAWAWTWNQYKRLNTGVCLNWSNLLPQYFFCHNIRNLDGIKSYGQVSSRSIFIPDKFNYLPDNRTHENFIEIFLDSYGNPLVETSKAGILPMFNAHYSGIEGKYLMQLDSINILASYYDSRPALKRSVFNE